MTDTNLVGYRHAEGDPANDAERHCVHDRVGGTVTPETPSSRTATPWIGRIGRRFDAFDRLLLAGSDAEDPLWVSYRELRLRSEA